MSLPPPKPFPQPRYFNGRPIGVDSQGNVVTQGPDGKLHPVSPIDIGRPSPLERALNKEYKTVTEALMEPIEYPRHDPRFLPQEMSAQNVGSDSQSMIHQYVVTNLPKTDDFKVIQQIVDEFVATAEVPGWFVWAHSIRPEGRGVYKLAIEYRLDKEKAAKIKVIPIAQPGPHWSAEDQEFFDVIATGKVPEDKIAEWLGTAEAPAKPVSDTPAFCANCGYPLANYGNIVKCQNKVCQHQTVQVIS